VAATVQAAAPAAGEQGLEGQWRYMHGRRSGQQRGKPQAQQVRGMSLPTHGCFRGY
jgi:hypothetical protein